MRGILCFFLFSLMISANNPPWAAEDQALNVAVAANFVRPMDKIVDIFEQSTGIKLHPVYSSTGKLYAQIQNGAPFDLFLAADVRRPELLYQQGMAEKPVTYAKGQVVLWTARKDLCKASDWEQVVKRKDVKRIAIASPQTAPYGEMALMALKKTGLWHSVEPRLVYAQAVSQAFQYAEMGGVDMAFTALSYALSEKGKKGCFWPVPQAPLIIQEACVLKKTRKMQQAEQFLFFLTSEEVRPILMEYGYR